MVDQNSGGNQFIQQLTNVIDNHLSESDFGVNELASELGMSRTTLHRRLKVHTDTSVSIFIREYRLKKAYELLRQKQDRVAEIAHITGFNSTTYFIKCFKEYYGFPPGDVLKGKHETDEAESTKLESAEENNSVNRKKTDKSRLVATVIVALSVALFTIAALWYFTNKKSNNQENTIAILPFQNHSTDPENQYFADGIMESLLNLLNQIGNFRVVSKTSVEQFRQSTKTANEIAEIFDVNYIVEGSVQQQKNKIRVNVQLVDAKNDIQLTSLQFDKQLTDIFEIQSNIARQIAGELQMTLSPRDIEIIEKVPTNNIEAYNLYLKGRFFWNTRTKFGLQNSIEFFNQAVELDPDFALAWAGLADAYHILSGWGWYIPKEEGEEIAKQYAIKALEIDPNLAEAHATLGFILCYIEWEWEEAEDELTEAIRLNPNYAFARQIYSQLSDIKGDRKKAREQIDIALELDPLSPIIHYISATLYYNEGNFIEALNECKEIKLLEENFTSIHWWIFKNYYRLGDGANALNELKIMFEQDTLTQKYSEQAETIFVERGHDGLIELLVEVTEMLININPDYLQNLYWKGYLSELYAIAGNKEKALELIEFNMEKNTEGDRFIRLINNYDYLIIREEERFRQIVDTLGLTEYYTKTISK